MPTIDLFSSLRHMVLFHMNQQKLLMKVLWVKVFT